MNKDKVISKFANFVKKELDFLRDVMVIQNADGSYELFDRYYIKKKGNGYFEVRTSTDTKCFSSLKNAVTWCIYEKNCKLYETKRIEYLDNILASLEVSIPVHERMIKRHKSLDDKLIHMAKLQDAILKKQRMNKELQKHISISKYWQSKKFEKE